MAHKKKHTPPVPPGNQPHTGPAEIAPEAAQDNEQANAGAPFSDQDPQRRLGDYEGTGEHSIQQPGGKNDANH